MISQGLHYALKGEIRLRFLARTIDEKSPSFNIINTIEAIKNGTGRCSKTSELVAFRSHTYTVDGSAKYSRKRTVFTRLLIAVARCLFRSTYRKEKTSISTDNRIYLAYPSLVNPKFLINPSHKMLSVNFPLIFSSNKSVNRLHLWLLVLINRYSSSSAERDNAIIGTGIGLVKVNSNGSKVGQGKNQPYTNCHSDLIILSQEKNIYFLCTGDKSLPVVVSWNLEITDIKTRLSSPQNRFETPLYNSFFGGRKLVFSNFYSGDPLWFSSCNLGLAIDKIFKIQSIDFQPNSVPLEKIMAVLNNFQAGLGLSDIEIKTIKNDSYWLFNKHPDFFTAKSLHGDCVPRNIILNIKDGVFFIDSSHHSVEGFFLTDIATLIVSFMAGEPKKSSPRLLKTRKARRRFQMVKEHIMGRVGMKDDEVELAIMIGLFEKIRLCEYEDREDVTNYWVELTKYFIASYVELNLMKLAEVGDDSKS